MFKTFKPSEAMLANMKARMGVSDIGDSAVQRASTDTLPTSGHRLTRAGIAICSPHKPPSHTPAGAFLSRCLEAPQRADATGGRRLDIPRIGEKQTAEPPAKPPLASHRSAYSTHARDEKRRKSADGSAALLRSLSSNSAKRAGGRGNSASSARGASYGATPSAPSAFYAPQVGASWASDCARPSARSTGSNRSGATAKLKGAAAASASASCATVPASQRSRPRAAETTSTPTHHSRPLRIADAEQATAIPVDRAPAARVPGSSRSRSGALACVKEETPQDAPEQGGVVPCVASAPTLVRRAPYKFVAKPAPSFAHTPANYSRKKVKLKDASPTDVGAGQSAQDISDAIEQQKMRLASKMEILDFYADCQSRMRNMTRKHNDKHTQNLRCDGPEKVAKALCMFGAERQKEMSTWLVKSNDKACAAKCLKRINALVREM